MHASRFVVDRTFAGACVCDVASRVAEGMVTELTDHDAADVVELFEQTLVVLQRTPFLDSGLVTWLYDPLVHAGKISVFSAGSDS